jgi:mannose-6-phosphate isomerase-like protein (cupin superfamily)
MPAGEVDRPLPLAFGKPARPQVTIVGARIAARDARRGAEMVEKARLEELASGLAPASDGWFIVNVRDAAWETGPFGAGCFFESEAAPFAELGINLRVVLPGDTRWLYHAESNQEDFLVLVGECLLLIEGEERPLGAWDFVHCPPHTEHASSLPETVPA